MICRGCQRENRPDARFCDHCGRPTTGPADRTREREPGSYTPRHLADKILTSRSALEGERKQVTVLFADLKRSLELSHSIDPERWHAILDHFFAVLAAGVHRFEGTINQFLGDGIMALFGAPIAHEDHARRACAAALHLQAELRRYGQELRREHGLDFQARIGLNSGQVVVGKIGDDLRMDYTAQGPTVGLAARMEELAEAGRIYLAPATAELARGYFELALLGDFKISGTPDPVSVHELVGVGPLRSRFDASRARGLSRFVGRASELQALEEALEESLAGSGRIMSVIGDAGVGKSRLCHEFLESCRARRIAVYLGQALSHARSLPLHALLGVYRASFGVTSSDSDLSAREKIAGRTLLLDPELADALPFVFGLLGVSDPETSAPEIDPDVLKERLRTFTARFVSARSRREPAVILIEDLHWLDPASEEWLPALTDAVAGTRTLFIGNFRPEYEAAWHARPNAREVRLRPLAAKANAALLHDLMGDDATLTDLKREIAQRTAGNPFFVEEVVRALAESGQLAGERGRYRLVGSASALRVPDSVQAILAARIDRLDEPDKLLLQTAAVIGPRFGRSLLEQAGDLAGGEFEAALLRLQRREFVFEEALYPEVSYAFQHPLTREVAYASPLQTWRAQTHERVARVLAARTSDRPDDHAALLAHHFEAGGVAREAAHWHAEAARRAARSDRAEAQRHWRRVRAQLALLQPAEAESIAGRDLSLEACREILQLGQRAGLDPDELESVFEQGRSIARERGDLRTLTLLSHSVTRAQAGDVREWLRHAEETAALAAQSGDRRLHMYMQVDVANAHLHLGHLREALGIAERNLELARSDPDLVRGPEGVRGYESHSGFRGLFLMHLGRLAEATEQFSQLEAYSSSHGSADWLRSSVSGRAEVASLAGDHRGALAYAVRNIELAEKLATPFDLFWAHYMLGLAHAAGDRWKEASESLERALDLGRTSGTIRPYEVMIMAALARALAGEGRADAALETADAACALAEREHAILSECGARLALGIAHLAGDLASGLADSDARRALDRALELALRMEARSLEAQIREARSRLAARSGDRPLHEQELAAARELFREMGASGQLRRLAR